MKQLQVPLPKDENEWARVRAEFASRITPSVTRDAYATGVERIVSASAESTSPDIRNDSARS